MLSYFQEKKKYENYIYDIIRLLLNTTFIMKLGSNSLSELTIPKFVIRIFQQLSVNNLKVENKRDRGEWGSVL